MFYGLGASVDSRLALASVYRRCGDRSQSRGDRHAPLEWWALRAAIRMTMLDVGQGTRF
jgi:hypothetical protein